MCEAAMADLLPFEQSTRPRRHVDKSGERLEIFNPSKAVVKNLPHPLEKARQAWGLTVAELARRSRTERHVLKNILGGRRQPHAATLRRIEAAFAGIQEERRLTVVRQFREIARAICHCRHVSYGAFLATDFSVQRPRNKAWLANARIRNLATYVLVVEFGIQEVAAAAAIAVSRTAVTKALRHCEEERAAFEWLITPVCLRAARGR
jgi:transcriptional regulator with XRE-family HTH domain